MIRKVVDGPEAGFVWIDIVTPSEDELELVAREYGLHQNLVMDCLQPDHLPKYEKIGPIEFFIVRHYDADAAPDADTVRKLTRKIAVFYGSGVILTIHRMDHAFLLDLQRRWTGTDSQKRDPFRIACSIIFSALLTYESRINDTVATMEKFEDDIFSGNAGAHMSQDIFIAKRQASVMSRMIHLTMDIIDGLDVPSEEDRPVLNDVRDMAGRLYYYAGKLQEDVGNIISLQISLASLKTNEVMRVLTLFSVFFMPLTFIAGVYGMNFVFMPELKMNYGYPAVIFLMALVSLVIYLWFKKKRWM